MTTSPDSVIYPKTPYGVLPQDQNAFYGDSGTNKLPLQAPMLKWRKAIANVRTATARAKLLVVGDSTTMGAGAGTGGATNLNASFLRSFPTRMASVLNTTFVATNYNAIWGNQGCPITYATYDPRAVFGVGWGMSGGGTLGNTFISFTNGGGIATFAFTPALSFDRIDVWYYAAPGQGTFTTDVDGGASLGTTNTAIGTGFLKTTFTVAAGTHTININAQNTGGLFISGIIPYLSTTSAVDVIPAGWFGALAGTINGSGSFGPLTALRALAPDCTVINLTINDSNAATNIDVYRNNMKSIINAAQESGDVVLMVGAPSDSVRATNGTLGLYVNVVYELAASESCAVVDMKRRWGSYDDIQPTFPYYDTLHPGNLAYADQGQAVASALTFQ